MEKRIKFKSHRIVTSDFNIKDLLEEEESFIELNEVMQMMEIDGATPILADNKVGGNSCLLCTKTLPPSLIVTKSGKNKNEILIPAKDFVHVQSFNKEKWECEYSSSHEHIMPTSDTPLYYYALILAPYKLNWRLKPLVALHGHFLPTEEILNKFKIPISPIETMFSTKEDAQAMFDILALHPYPENKIFVRRGHGFFILGQTVKECKELYVTIVKQFFTSLGEE